MDKNEILSHLSHKVFKTVGNVADNMQRECYVVGGYVRDIFLHRPSTDIDFVVVGSGIELARGVAQSFGRGKSHLSVFKTYGTAQVKTHGMELEFVGARRESYQRNSRNPIVEDGTLDDDQKRRDFTINAMAISVNKATFGELLDPFDGIGDLERRIIRTPLDPDITFSDDPLRMMRAVRFATQLDFDIYPETLQAIKRNASRIGIITRERIAEELMKIMRASKPQRGFMILEECGLLKLIFPELAALKGVDTVNGRGHKDNFKHTMQVLQNVAEQSDNEWLRWAALLHDIGKPASKHWDEQQGWTFHNHNFIGEKMVPRIFGRMRLPLNEHMKYVKKLVGLHMRPIALVEDEVTDSAVRRLLFDAGDDIDDLMLLCSADITSKNQVKVETFKHNFELVRQKLVEIEEKDRVRNFQPPVDGNEIMTTFNLLPCREIGEIKNAIKDSILDGIIANDYAQAYNLMMQRASELGLKSVYSGLLCHTRFASPFGDIVIAASTQGIALIFFADKVEDRLEKIAKKRQLRLSEIESPLLQQCHKQIDEYFNGSRRTFSLPLDFTGTEFQNKVWQALQNVNYGTTVTYKQEAENAGTPDAVRAVATANAANNLLIVVPCHRVIGTNGDLCGYSGGIERKAALLDFEKHTLAKAQNSEE